MIAMLGMYDMPALRSDTDLFWHNIRAALGYGPDALTRDADVWTVWESPDLLLAQTCGYPYRARLHGRVTYVATPDYGLPGCPPGYYQSCFVVRASHAAADLRDMNGCCFAYNEALSQSGWAAPVHHMERLGLWPGSVLKTGAHQASALAVLEGRADLAALDAQTWRLLCAHDRRTDGLRVLDRTVPTPGLPLITALSGDAAALRRALDSALANLPTESADRLHLRGFVDIPRQAYLSVPSPVSPDGLPTTDPG